MKNRLIGLLILAFSSAAVWSQSAIPISGIVISQFGQPVPGAQIRVCLVTSSGTPCTPTTPIYQDYGLTIPSANPASADSNGNYTVYGPTLSAPGLYLVQVSPQAGTTYSYVVNGSAGGSSIILTTTGTSGAATLIGGTLNIPVYSSGGGGGLPVNNPTFTGALNGPQIGQTFIANSSTTGADWCAKVATAQTAAIAAGSNVVDATALTGAQTCANSLTTSTGIVVIEAANTAVTFASSKQLLPGMNSYIIGQNRQTSQIIGNVNGGCVVQLGNSGSTVESLTIQNNSSTAGSCDLGTSNVNERGYDLFLNNGYQQLYVANIGNAYYGDFRNIFFGNSGASAYNSVQCGNATYQCNESKFDHLVLMQGSNSCVDNEGSQGVTTINPDCEGGTAAAFIVNEAGGAQPEMNVQGGYIQIPGVCATINNGFLVLNDPYLQSCGTINGSSPSSYLAFIAQPVHTLNGSGINLTPGQDLGISSSTGTQTGWHIHSSYAVDVRCFQSASEFLTCSGADNTPSTYSFQAYGSIDNAFGTVIPYNVTGNTQVNSGLKMVIAPPIPGAGADLMTGPATSTPSHCANFADAVGTLADSGSPCSSGSVSGQANGIIPLASASTAITLQSHLDDGVTTAGTVTSSEPIAVAGTTHGVTIPAGSAVGGAIGKVVYASDATNGYAEVNENNTGLSRVCTAANGICALAAVNGAISSATGGAGTGTITCLTASCTNISGTYSVDGGTFTTGTLLTLVWPTTTAVYKCWTSQQGASLGLSHSVATATGMTISNATTAFGITVTFDYGCSAL